jgi:Plavaka transposase
MGFIADQEFQNDSDFRNFRRHLFHASLQAALKPLQSAMTKPEVTLCADGYYRRVIYGIGPYIADYPEQVLLSCIVQGWCPR